jgi:hypothetical protein
MRSQLTALGVCVLLLILPAVGAQAETIDVSDEIQVEGWPEPLRMRPGDTTEFTLTIRNDGERTLSIHLGWVRCECTYGHPGSVTPDLIILTPGASEEVTVTVTSGDKYRGDNDGEGMLTLEWGPDLTMVGGSPDDATVEDDGGIPINIVAENDTVIGDQVAILVVVAIAIIAVVIAVIVIRRSGDREPEAR